MTIIESFEKAPIENLISVLTTKPQKVIYLGEVSQMKASMIVYEKILKEKGIEAEIVLKGIQKNNLQNILQVLTEIVETEKECLLDITGGEDLVLLAFGMIYERYKNSKPVKMQRFNINTGRIIDCDLDDEVTFEGTFSMDVKELISVYGGIVVPEDPQPMVENAIEEVDRIWELARTDSTSWNKSISNLKEFERKGNVIENEEHRKYEMDEEEKLRIRLDLSIAKEVVGEFHLKHHAVEKLLKEFAKERLIQNLSIEKDIISYKYKNAFVKRCLNKAGDALEMKCYFEAMNLEHRGKPYFNDCYVGVVIDWDGIIHTLDENWKDTTNEIDVMLMKGLIPVFISCKHGKIGEEELYKLNTVATRFGGKYAKKMLVATHLEKESASSMKAYLQRAKDMNIELIPNARDLSKKDWQKIFMQVVS